ncbi:MULTISPECIES: squalene/phytoene synthase family protein [Micrococcaceae]|uniref:phytoene/squalene synthase family protein n=1 Tax=Micrococcaceae TaxID=1268 RepID=UPI001610FA7F|nr:MULTISPECIES: squalene/phytoene synthase family protein [Micrococcaceae]MBB5749868.1 phytoene/squalene synthetase [Micrococcus sp. TA1]HRO29249.1 squalene/phytoene synthase family protein [Citricoccus sp.]HRO92718.1 squalene/phytoene synthase family protein [Citricoccus sp.]
MSAPDHRYDDVAQASAAQVIAGYSTSFGWATRLLARPVRTHVRNIYALVRVADEIVDDPDPALTPAWRREQLDELEAETYRALDSTRSSNLVVHAFALTARRFGIGPGLVGPFFASMRADLVRSRHDAQSLSDYVHGSAEVVGLMCLRVFTGGDVAAYERLRPGAERLGAAFQKVNFLRDLADDHDQLGRTYFPGLDPAAFSDAHRDELLDDIDADLAAAAEAIRLLPDSSRRAVRAAHALYSALSRRLRSTPAARIRESRIRVPDGQKAVILVKALAGRTA